MFEIKRILWILISCQINFNLSKAEGPEVCISDGCLKGKSSPDGYDEFLGIPYAEPPIKNLRFQNPQPVKQWGNTVLDATTEKEDCIQKNVLLINNEIIGKEDCLYLNVYTPTSVTKNNLPVIVFIHGGGWLTSNTGPTYSGPKYFMDTKKVVLVIMAYRLGPFGFLSTGDDVISGNFGLKDQALAIEWIYKNIAKFNGDPSSITCAGQSSGAASCHLHMMNPIVAPRLSNVILMSGSALAPWAQVEKHPKLIVRKFAKAAGILNAETLNSHEIADELMKMSASEIIEAHEKLRVWDIDPLTIFRPVIEKCVEGAYICVNPIETWKCKKYRKIPILTGITQMEGGVRGLKIIDNQTLMDSYNNDFDNRNEMFYMFDHITKRNLQKFKEVYFKGISRLTEDNKFGLVDAYSDRMFVQPLLKTVKQFLRNRRGRKVPIYLYKFDFKAWLSYSFLFVSFGKFFGTIHCDDLIFTLSSPFINFPIGGVEMTFISQWIDFLVEFATTGKLQNYPRCYRFNENNPGMCPYTHFVRESQFADSYNVTTRYDLPLKVVPFMNQIEGSSAVPRCDIWKNHQCGSKYCC